MNIQSTKDIVAAANNSQRTHNSYDRYNEAMNGKNGKYILAFSYKALTPLYDSIMKHAMPESTFKNRLASQVRLDKGRRVLDLGCGTATLTLFVKKDSPEAEVFGVDGDSEILKIARRKIAKAIVDITLNRGAVFELPYSADSFDCVVSSLVFHHLTREDKIRSLKEVFRVLKPQGELYVADFAKPQNALMRLTSLIMRWLEENHDNVRGLLPRMFRNAGFDQVEETAKFMTMFGTISLLRAQKHQKHPKGTCSLPTNCSETSKNTSQK